MCCVGVVLKVYHVVYGEISTLHITSEMQGFVDFVKVESRDALSVSIMQC